MNEIPVLYIGLTIFFSGFIVSSVIQSIYRHEKTRRTDTLPFRTLNLAAALYILCDAIAVFFAFIFPKDGLFRLFTALREFAPFLAVVIAPYFLNRALEVSDSMRKFNRSLFRIGLVVSVTAGAIAVWDPGTLIRLNTFVDGRFNASASFYSRTGGPLLVARDILLAASFLYSVTVMIFYEARQKAPYTFLKNIIGILLFGYFLFSYLYSIIFSSSPAGYGAVPYPHLGLGVTLLIAFMTIYKIDVDSDYYSELADVKNSLERIVTRDPLIGVPNRAGFMRDLKDEIDVALLKENSFSLLFLDIDDFQNLNESYGESIGDIILRQFALRLAELFGGTGSLYRIGGDDFAFLLRDVRSDDEAANLADRITSSLRNPFYIEGGSYLVTASIGVLLLPRDGGDPEAVIKNAYSVIRYAKQIKNTYRVFNPDLVDASSTIIQTVNLLRDSINRDQFTLFYQPIVDRDERIIYAESLLRCTNDNPLLGGPGNFIPIVERAGLSKEVDGMVIHKAFHDMEVHIRKRFKISINLSTDQLVNPKYSDFLSSFANQHGIENRYIVLEVTENQLMSNLSSGRESLKKLQERGFSIAVDDFGTGFSSLAYLTELPIDILKIDIIFVQSIPGDPKKEAMANHIIQLAHALGLKVIAEGFETREQFNFFRNLGCDFFQGYLFSPPLPVKELLKKYGNS